LNRFYRILFLALGAGVFAYVVWRIGPEHVLGHLTLIGWGVLPILATSAAWKSVNTAAWMLAFPPESDRPGFWKLLAAWLAADVANHVLPAANLGGEVARSYLLRSSIPVSRSLPTVVVDKTMEILSGLLFTIIGVGIAVYSLPLANSIRYGLLASILVGTAAILYGIRIQSRNPLSRLMELFIRLPIPTSFLESRRESAARMDTHLETFYSKHVGRFWIGFLLHFISWIVGAIETYYIILYMDVEITFFSAFLLTSLTGIIKAAFFFVPAGIGAFEAGHAYLFYLLSFSPAIGLSVAVVKRLRRLFWMGTGVLLFYGQMLIGGATPKAPHSPDPEAIDSAKGTP
jgi:uncharacterized protein (TIRG00374 family)